MIVAANQVLMATDTWEPGPHMAEHYRAFVDADLSDCRVLVERILPVSLRDYLDKHFAGTWRLLRRVDEKQSAAPRKVVHYLLEMATDADAETVTRWCRVTAHGCDDPSWRGVPALREGVS